MLWQRLWISRECAGQSAQNERCPPGGPAGTIGTNRDELEELAQLVEQLPLALGADQALLGLAVLEHDERGDAHHVEAAGDVRVVVDVELGDADLAGLLAGDL